MNKRGLGRGLDALLSGGRDFDRGESLLQVPVKDISANPFQPRREFDPERLEDLASSIRLYGVLQPIVVRKNGDGYQLVTGERRWRASQIAGLREVPAVLRDYTDVEMTAVALVENLQREDLNPIEEAIAYRRLIDEFGLTHQQTAEAVGRSRVAVTNLLRLLELQPEVKALLDAGQFEMGHARALLALQGAKQVEIAKLVAQRQLSVRDTERLIKQVLENTNVEIPVFKPSPDVVRLEQRLADTLGAKVAIRYNRSGKGKLVIEYNSLDELDGILEHIQ